MGYFLTDPFTHMSMTNFMDKPSQTQQFKTEDYDGDGSITDADTNREVDLAACPNPNPQGYFPQNADGTCPTNSYTMAGGAPCNCLCANNYHPVVTWVAGSPHNYPVTECQENANLGCTDEFNENYDSTATEHRHSDCGDCLEGYAVNPSGGFCELIEDIPIWGCMDENARDYEPLATEHQGPCGPCNPNYGRREVTAENVNEVIWCEAGSCSNAAFTTKGICESSGEVWTFDSENNGGGNQPECNINENCEDGYVCVNQECVEKVEGCTDPNSNEYNSAANVDNGTCISCITGYEKDSQDLCSDCATGYTKDAAGQCYEDTETNEFPWLPVAGLALGLVLVLS